MSTIEVGQTITWALTNHNSAGALTDAGALPVATVTLPDGTTTTATVVKTTTGTYSATLVSTQAGRHRVRWTSSGADSGGFPYTDLADVWPADPRLIISLADARNALNVPSGTRVNDDELRLFIAATTPVIEDIAGPVLAATKVESRDGDGRTCIPLYEYPSGITSVVENGTTLAASDYYLDSAGILWRGASKGAGRWSSTGRIVVTYTVGSGVIPPNVILAAREEVRFLWQVGQQGQRPAFNGGDTTTGYTPTGYAVPNRVLELLAASTGNKVPGIA